MLKNWRKQRENIQKLGKYAIMMEEFGLFSSSERRSRGELIIVYKYLHGEKIQVELFNPVKKGITRTMPQQFYSERRHTVLTDSD